jgi:flagellar basal-body rod modification protein FlgD
MTSPISAVSPATTAGATTAPTGIGSATGTAASNGMALDPQAFLQLLVAQLQYQDPTNPVDTSTFMNQTAMLSQVETMNSMSTTLTGLVAAQQAQAATELLGKTVTYTDASGNQQTGTVSSASLAATGPTLQIGTDTVPLTSVTQVTASPSNTPSLV